MFDSGRVSSAAVDLQELRARVRRMESATAAAPREIDTHPALAGLVQLRAGGVYEVDADSPGRLSLMLALLAGPSRTGAWCGVVGVPDFGVAAAAELGIVLSRTILVPEPGESWLEATAALVDVAGLVVVRPPERVPESVAAKLGARLRKRGAALVSLGRWPRSDLRLSASEPAWSGAERGHGYLTSRRIAVEVRRSSGAAGPARRAVLWFPHADGEVRQAEPVRAERPLAVVRSAG